LTDEEYLSNQDGSSFDNPCHNVMTIGERAFYDCDEIMNISLPASLSIGAYAFSVCILMKNDIANNILIYSMNIQTRVSLILQL